VLGSFSAGNLAKAFEVGVRNRWREDAFMLNGGTGQGISADELALLVVAVYVRAAVFVAVELVGVLRQIFLQARGHGTIEATNHKPNGGRCARGVMKKVTMAAVKGDLSRLLCAAQKQQIVITRQGKPAGVLIGFADDEEWTDYQLENDPRFLRGTAAARKSIKAGKGVRLEDVQ
jgi:prevent-host-death family protein